jgi:hypothetical protein
MFFIARSNCPRQPIGGARRRHQEVYGCAIVIDPSHSRSHVPRTLLKSDLSTAIG